jgi:nicotinic acid phosphoribosyltransferase
MRTALEQKAYELGYEKNDDLLLWHELFNLKSYAKDGTNHDRVYSEFICGSADRDKKDKIEEFNKRGLFEYIQELNALNAKYGVVVEKDYYEEAFGFYHQDFRFDPT